MFARHVQMSEVAAVLAPVLNPHGELRHALTMSEPSLRILLEQHRQAIPSGLDLECSKSSRQVIMASSSWYCHEIQRTHG